MLFCLKIHILLANIRAPYENLKRNWGPMKDCIQETHLEPALDFLVMKKQNSSCHENMVFSLSVLKKFE